ncbi:MAG TPA: NYN domain-containing protein [Solirubrobacteraceae bacterium]|nr:NYN domain-containing protein [Solirubrobacteraceae bacterium]
MQQNPSSAHLPVTPATAVFVDAGWLLAAAGLATVGARRREEVACDYGGLLESLTAHVDRHSAGMRLLRTYWYDAAVGGVPSHEHNRIAAYPYVNLRLGRLSRNGQQKGVDVLIYRDLMKLARERVISRAYLIAGDEDLRQGVVEAKEVGVQVVLLGMPIEEGQNQSVRLVRDSDEYAVLPSDVWEGHFRRRDPDEPSDDEAVALARRLGDGFARRWAGSAPADDVGATLDAFPKLPQPLDLDLIVFAETELGSLRGRPDLKQEVRGAFWSALRQAGGAG